MTPSDRPMLCYIKKPLQRAGARLLLLDEESPHIYPALPSAELFESNPSYIALLARFGYNTTTHIWSKIWREGDVFMNKNELITAMAAESGLSKADTEKALNAFISQVGKALQAGDKIQLTGFGSFEVKERAERTGRNPKTKEPITIPAGKAPVFKAGKALKDAVG